MRNMPKPTAKSFAAQLKDAFESAAADRDNINWFKELAEQHPTEAAGVVCKAIPRLMRRERTQACELHGVDIEHEGWKDQFKQKQPSEAEAGLLLMAANYYLVYSWLPFRRRRYLALLPSLLPWFSSSVSFLKKVW